MSEKLPQFKTATEVHQFSPEEITQAQESFEAPKEQIPEQIEASPSESGPTHEEQVEAIRERLSAHAELPVSAEAPPMPLEASPASVAPEVLAKRSQAQKLFDSLNLAKKGFFSRKNIVESGQPLEKQLISGLNDERSHNKEIRDKVRNAIAIGTAGTFVGTVGVGMLATGTATLGLVTLPVAAVGGLGYLGLRTYQGLKQREHRKKFNQLYHGGDRGIGALRASVAQYK